MGPRWMLALVGTVVACRGGGAAIDAAIDAPIDIDAAVDAPPGVPDLTLIGAEMDGTVVITQDVFAPGDCEVLEACVGGAGARRLLRFDTVTANLGTGDLVIGPPPPDGVSDALFVWSTCHQHHHVNGYAQYELRDGAGVVVGGHKQAFCLQDIQQARPGWPSRGYTCTNQGLSAGWADVYSRYLPCQWIDITAIAPGAYTLVVRINPTGLLAESDPTNNEWTLAISF